MRRLRIICDTDRHTSEVIEAIARLKPQYLIFAEEELDPKHRIDTLPRADEMPAGLLLHTERQAPELKGLPGPKRKGKNSSRQLQQEYWVTRRDEHNAKLDFRPDPNGKLIFEAGSGGHNRINIDASLKSFGLTSRQLGLWKTTESTDLSRLKFAIMQRARRGRA